MNEHTHSESRWRLCPWLSDCLSALSRDKCSLPNLGDCSISITREDEHSRLSARYQLAEEPAECLNPCLRTMWRDVMNNYETAPSHRIKPRDHMNNYERCWRVWTWKTKIAQNITFYSNNRYIVQHCFIAYILYAVSRKRLRVWNDHLPPFKCRVCFVHWWVILLIYQPFWQATCITSHICI